MSRLLAFLLVSLFLGMGSAALANGPSGVYVCRVSPHPALSQIDEWDFREDGTVLYRTTTKSNDGKLVAPTRTSVYFWRTPWFSKNVEIMLTKDGDRIVAFTRDGNDLIGTGRFTEARERYRKQ